MTARFEAVELPRGGLLVRWGDFVAQIGAYPETIKDTMVREPGVPDLYILPDLLFDLPNGISLAELEFPLYYNFYIKQRKLRFICRRHQLRPILRVLHESLFGPHKLELEPEFPRGRDTPGFPDLAAEMAYYKQSENRENSRTRDMATPLLVDEETQSIAVDGVIIHFRGNNRFLFERDGEGHELTFRAYHHLYFTAPKTNYFSPPQFGVTVIGAGHGFDAQTLTSGFIIWLNGRGILVDPPVNCTEWLRSNGLDARQIEDLVLTHCHADHDAGTLQKVLQEGRIKLHTTPTVMKSFVRKYRALTGFSEEEFYRLFSFQPIMVGRPINILGGQFRFRYTLHPIPTLGFEVEYQGKRFAYSCDTLYDPDLFKELHQRGVMSGSRMQDLLDFAWDADLIFHEAGVPPIHTPIEILAQQPEEVKERMYLNHVSASAVPPGSNLRVAPTGLHNTLRLNVDAPALDLAHRMLDVLIHTDLFRTLPLRKSLEFLRITHPIEFKPGETIIRTGEAGDRFFMIMRGEAWVKKDGLPVQKLTRYDYFGEMAVVLDQDRYADVEAHTDMTVLTIDRVDFLQFIADTHLPKLLRQVAHNKMTDAWPVMAMNRHLAPLTSFQRSQLMSVLHVKNYDAGQVLFSTGGLPLQLYLIADGQVMLRDSHGRSMKVERGALLGKIPTEGALVTHQTHAEAASDVRVFVASLKDLQGFFNENPGTYVRIRRGLRESPFSTTS